MKTHICEEGKFLLCVKAGEEDTNEYATLRVIVVAWVKNEPSRAGSVNEDQELRGDYGFHGERFPGHRVAALFGALRRGN